MNAKCRDPQKTDTADEWLMRIGSYIGRDEISITDLVIRGGKVESFLLMEL